MSLQNRFRLLLAIFGVSVVANVLVSVWCIHIYVGEATSRFELLMFSLRNTDQVCRLIDGLTDDLRQRPGRDVRDTRYRMLSRQVVRTIEDLPISEDDPPGGLQRDRLLALASRLSEAAERYVELLDSGQGAEAQQVLAGPIVQECVKPMQQILAGITLESDASLRKTSAAVGDKEALVTTILTLNAVAAFLLAAAGVHLVRNWVLKPVAALKAAAEQHASGNLEYRIEHIPGDELGVLSREINRMADSLIKIQRRVLEHERMAVIGEMTSTVAHNIRNPLAGIRASAQSSLADLPESSDVSSRQEDIVRTVDSLNRWLRELLQVSQPIELNCRPTAVADVVARVTGVLHTSAECRGIRFAVDESPSGCVAGIDPPRVEQALLTIVVNALDASPTGGEVRIETRRDPGGGWIVLRVVDRGAGIPPEVIDHIASPYFSTKPRGTGIGLYLAKRVVQAHGGAMEFQNNSDGGTTVMLRLPAATGSVQGARS